MAARPSNIEMLPLPEADDSVENHAQWPIVIDSDVWLQDSVQSYARAVAEHNVRLRGGIDPLAVLIRAQEAEARAERLEETLRLARDLVEDWAGYAGEYFQKKHNLEGDLALLDAVLRDHDKEARNG